MWNYSNQHFRKLYGPRGTLYYAVMPANIRGDFGHRSLIVTHATVSCNSGALSVLHLDLLQVSSYTGWVQCQLVLVIYETEYFAKHLGKDCCH